MAVIYHPARNTFIHWICCHISHSNCIFDSHGSAKEPNKSNLHSGRK